MSQQLANYPTFPIAQIDPNPWNPNRMSDQVVEAERQSIREFGFIDPVTVRINPGAVERRQIIDGEHRWRIAREEGYTEVPIVDLGEVDDATAKRLTVILNETRGEADVVLLGQLLTELQDTEGFSSGMPFTSAELDHLLALGTEDWDQFTRGDGNGGAPEPPPELRELVLAMKPKVYDTVMGHIQILRKEYGMDDDAVTEPVVEAIRRAALEANTGQKPPPRRRKTT